MSEAFEEEEFEDFVDAIEDVPQAETPNYHQENELFPLHQAVFEHRSVSFLSELLSLSRSSPLSSKRKSIDVGQKDLHGNTPLHLAVMLGHKDHINFLLQQNAPIKTKNCQGWTPLDEAISYGDRKIIKSILRMGRKQARQSLDSRSPKVLETLRLIKDFQMELRWEFYSWIPLLKRFLPSDICRIAKRGASIRLDTTLLDFDDRRWHRGNITFLFLGDSKESSSSSTNTAMPSSWALSSVPPDHSLVIMDNELKVYQYLRYNESMDIDEHIDLLMSSDLIYPQLNTKTISFSRTQTGWFFARYNKTEKVGQFEADFYNVNGFTIETKKRREHLSDEDVHANKALYETLKKSLDASNNREQQKNRRRLSNKSSITDSSSFDDIVQINDDQLMMVKNDSRSGDETLNGHVFHEASITKEENQDIVMVRDENLEDNDIDEEGDENLIEAAMVSMMTNGSGNNDHLTIKRRKSLPPPVKPNVSWEDYIRAPKGSPPCLGRSWKMKESSRTFKATVAMSQEFPLTIESLLNILEVITQFKHFKKLKEFVNLNLPPGFPVKIDIPIIPTILARVTFLNFTYNDKINASLFEIPADYTEDPERFPDL